MAKTVFQVVTSFLVCGRASSAGGSCSGLVGQHYVPLQ